MQLINRADLIDQHPLRYSQLVQAIEGVILHRSVNNGIEGRTLETAIEVAQAVVDLLSKPPSRS